MMKPAKNFPYRSRHGSALLLSLIFIAMFSALATAMSALSSANVQIAENQRKLDNARGSAESGLEVVRYWMGKMVLSGTPDERFSRLATSLQNELDSAGVTNLAPVYSGSTITISEVPLNSSSGQSFSAVLTNNTDSTQVDVTGHYGALDRTVRSNFIFIPRADNVFDYGIASKSPISLNGNIDLEGQNIDVEANAYIDCDELLALSIVGNSMIAGEVKIRNSLANVHLQGHAGVGGEYGANAMDHIEFGAPPSDFPEMDPTPFFPYATNVLSPTANLSSDATYENLHIPAGRDPHFSGNLTLRGVIFIETPNVVSFSGNVNITGIIVTNGSSTDNSATNQISFTGNVTSYPVSQLPQQAQFEGLHTQTGTFLLAPGFTASFGGNFSIPLSGAIAANGIRFHGNAGGIINGSIINYADGITLEMSGNSDLRFNRSGLTELPAGFVPRTVMQYDPSAYSESPL